MGRAMLPADDCLDSSSGASRLNVWFPGEYEAGYHARLAGSSESWTATACWQAGWQEADRELADSGQSLCSSPFSCSVDLEATESRVFESGELARNYGIPFDQTLSDSWKRSWIRRDIEVGMFARRDKYRRGICFSAQSGDANRDKRFAG